MSKQFINFGIYILLIVCVLVASPSNSQAGDWKYGCISKPNAEIQIRFNRFMLTRFWNLKQKDMNDVAEDFVESYDAADINSGFSNQMVFEREYTGGTKVTLTFTEKSSKTLSEKSEEIPCSNDRYRDVTNTTFEKEFELKNSQFNENQKVKLDCYEYQLSTCG
jgi:hypothetical protein